MKKGLLFLAALLLAVQFNFAQTRTIKITYDATSGNAGMAGASSAYIHSGAGTTGPTSAWEHVVGNWGMDDGIGQMTQVGNDLWEIEIDFDAYYANPANYADPANAMASSATVYGIGLVFRNADGSLEGKDASGSDIFIRGLDTATPMVEDASAAPFAGVTVEFVTAGSIEDDMAALGLASFTNAPNPVSGSTTFMFDLNNRRDIKLSIMDMTGRTVAVVADEDMNTGSHKITWDANVAPGVYFYQIASEGITATKKLIVTK